MEEPWKTFGHGQSKRLLERHLETGRFPHAYLFSGPEGVGKKMLALEFAGKILQTDRLEKHPDFLMLDQSGELTVDALRGFISRLSLKPLLAQKKVAIVNNADRMNIQSGNALLKTLEEPSPSTVIILIGDSQRMLGTIRSRCQIVNMQLFSPRQLAEFALSQKFQASGELADLSFGSPGELARLAASPEAFTEKQKLVAQWQRLKNAKIAERLVAIGDLSDLEPEQLQNTLLTWLYGEESNLPKNPKQFPAMAALEEAYWGLLANQNKKSVLQDLFLKI